MKKIVAIALVLGTMVALPWLTAAYAQANPGQAEVIFHRPDKIKWKATRFNIEQDGRPIGQLRAGSEIALSLDPGTYTFTTTATSLDGVDHLTLTVEAGKTYRVKGEVLASWPVGRPKFTDVSESGVATPVTSSPPEAQPASESAPQEATASASGSALAGIKSFSGDWNMEMWSLDSNGDRIEGKGTATGSPVGDYSIRIDIEQFDAPSLPDAVGGGFFQITLHPERGLLFASDFPVADRKLELNGQVQSGKYVFYLFGGGGETITGVQRTSLRLEIHSIDQDTWEANTFASFQGSTTQVQSARLIRR